MKKIHASILASLTTILLLVPTNAYCEELLPSAQSYARAKAYYEQSNYDAAITEYLKAIQTDNKNPQYYNGLGEVYTDKEEYLKAIKVYTKAINLAVEKSAQEQAKYYDNRGVAYYHQKNYNLAIADYTKAIALENNNPDHYSKRGAVYYYLRNFEQAKQDFLKALEINPEHKAALINMAKLASAQNDHKGVITYYTKVLKLDPKFLQAYNNRAWSYERMGEYEKALADMKTAIDINPNIAVLYRNYAASCMNLHNYSEAIKSLKQAIEIKDSKRHESYLLKAMCEMEIGNYKEALADINFAKKLSPTKTIYDWYYAALYQKQGNDELALKYYNNAKYWSTPRRVVGYIPGTVIWDKHDNKSAALDDFDKAIDLRETKPLAGTKIYNQFPALAKISIALIYSSGQNYEESLKCLTEAIRVKELDFNTRQTVEKIISKTQTLIQEENRLRQMLEENRSGNDIASQQEKVKILAKEINDELKSVNDRSVPVDVLPMSLRPGDQHKDSQITLPVIGGLP